VTFVIYHKIADLQKEFICMKFYFKLGKTDRQSAAKSVSFLLTDQHEESYECVQGPPIRVTAV
jgi:hypothetical protein